MSKDYKIVDNVLIIDEGRTEIGSHEFSGKFTKVIIPEGVTKIGYWAFGGCKQLEEDGNRIFMGHNCTLQYYGISIFAQWRYKGNRFWHISF